MNEVKFKLTEYNAVEPTKANNTDAGYDLTVTRVEKWGWFKVIYGFGLKIELPKHTYAALVPRSSIHKTYQLQANSYGVVDQGYRGEIMMICYRIPFLSKLYKVGERACQLIIKPTMKITWKKEENLTDSERGEGGFGSSNLKVEK